MFRRALTTVALAGVAVVPAVSDAYPGCNTQACPKRVWKKHMKRTVKPYRPWLRKVRMCESGGRYWIATGNGFYGAYQFTASTWSSAGGYGLPHRASKLEQDYRTVKWAKMIGWNNVHTTAGWPVCG